MSSTDPRSLAEEYGQSGGRFKAGVLDNRYEDSKRDFLAGFKAALASVELNGLKVALENLLGNYPGDSPKPGSIFEECVIDSQSALEAFRRLESEE